MNKIIINIPKYEIVENKEVELYLPLVNTFYKFDRSTYLGIYPKILENEILPWRYNWIYLFSDAFNVHILKGLLTIAKSNFEELLNYKQTSLEGQINKQLVNYLMNKEDGDYTEEYFDNEFRLAIEHLNRLKE